MKELLLRGLERKIRHQRLKVAADQQLVEHAIRALPDKAMQAVARPSGLLVSFALGAAAAAGRARTNSVAALVLWDVLARMAMDELPALANVIRDYRRERRQRRS